MSRAISAVLPDLSHLSVSVIDFLHQCGAIQRPHSGRTLFDHLSGTYQLLHAWGNPQHVCLAGLFHSIYGTNAFRHQCLDRTQRMRLQNLIGANAEQLAWKFCHLDRPQAIFSEIRMQVYLTSPDSLIANQVPNELHALAEIECANLIEQGDAGHSLRELFCLNLERPGVLSAAALLALRDVLVSQLREQTAVSVGGGLTP